MFRTHARVLAIAALALSSAWAHSACAEDDWVVPRRRDPFPTTQSYLALPLPYSIPGIGSGAGVVLYETNHLFPHRAYLVFLQGDIEAVFGYIEQVQLVEKRLLFDLLSINISKFQSRNYAFRGMDTPGSAYTLLEFDKFDYVAPQLTYTRWERRLDFYVQVSQSGTSLKRVRDSAGHVISSFTEPQRAYAVQTRGGVRLDLTDEFYDPRQGVRLVTEYSDTPRQSALQPDFYTLDYRLSAYLPVGKQSTLAFHAFQSDAVVRKTGETHVAVLNQIDDLGCAPSDSACLATQAAVVNNDLAANRNGTATTLGGDTYLRGYPADRFKGAHTLYGSVEMRWNLTDEFTPFDYLFFQDVRTGLQLAAFFEAGSVSEEVRSLGSHWKDDSGVGFRLVTASGSVYRADFAVGGEGASTVLTAFYPW